MAEQTYSIEFDGYWRDPNKAGIPAQSGIYCVYECTRNIAEKTVAIHKLIYIGEADDVCDRLANHEKHPRWLRHVRAGNDLCFSFGGVEAQIRARCEAAMIFKHKPPENTEYVDSFPFDRTSMELTGYVKLLTPAFTVNRT